MYLFTHFFPEVRLITQPMFLDDNYFFELMEPEEISYTYKIRPAKNFGVPIVSKISVVTF